MDELSRSAAALLKVAAHVGAHAVLDEVCPSTTMDRIYAVSAAHRDASNDEAAAATTTHETRYYVVNGRAGAQVRRTMSLQSARVAILDAGVVVASDKETTLEDGKLRIHVVAPREGWLSAKTVTACDAPAHPPARETPPLRQDESLLLPGERSASKRSRAIRKPGARCRLFALYGVADNSHNLVDWVWKSPPWLEVRLLELPGHGQRIKEALPACSASDADATAAGVVDAFRARRRSIAEDIADDLAPFVDEPYAFYGFSLGAMLLYEVCLVLAERGASPPLRFFSAGRGAPHCCACGARDFAALASNDDEFVLRWMRDTLRFDTDAFPKALRPRAGRLFRMGMVLGCHAGDAEPDPPLFWGQQGAEGDMPLSSGAPPLPCAITAIGSDVDFIWPPKTVDKWAAQSAAGFRRATIAGATHNDVMNHKESMAAVFADLEGALHLPP